MISRRQFISSMGACGGILAFNKEWSAAADQEPYPTKRIAWICPYKPGGGIDLTSRTLSRYMAKYFRVVSPGAKGEGIVIKNVPEGSGVRAYSAVYSAKPDGYTVGDFNIAFVSQTVISPKSLDFDIMKFTWLLRTGTTTRMLIANKKGFSSWKQMVEDSKKEPLKWAVGNFGGGSHIESIIVKEATNIPARFINFLGGVEQTNAILRGDVQVTLTSVDIAKPLVDGHVVNALVTFTDEQLWPGVPTASEIGYPNLPSVLGNHRLVFAPPGIPRDIQRIFIDTAKKVMEDKEYLEFGERSGFPASPLYGKDVENLVRKYIAYYQSIAPTLKKYTVSSG